MRTRADQPLDHAELWLRDGLRVLQPALSVLQVSVDMSNALRRLDELRQKGVQASSTHLVIQAAAHALAANPDLHQFIAGRRRYRPSTVDIGLSVTGESFVAPILVIEDADRKTIAEIATETARRAPEARKADERLRQTLRRWGWLVPFGFARRAFLRLLFASPSFRRKGAGTFQVSTVPADWAMTSSFSTAGVLFSGQVTSRVMALDGRPVVRPMMTLTLSGDHGVWDGRSAMRFVAAVKAELEAQGSS